MSTQRWWGWRPDSADGIKLLIVCCPNCWTPTVWKESPVLATLCLCLFLTGIAFWARGPPAGGAWSLCPEIWLSSPLPQILSTSSAHHPHFLLSRARARFEVMEPTVWGPSE